MLPFGFSVFNVEFGIVEIHWIELLINQVIITVKKREKEKEEKGYGDIDQCSRIFPLRPF